MCNLTIDNFPYVDKWLGNGNIYQAHSNAYGQHPRQWMHKLVEFLSSTTPNIRATYKDTSFGHTYATHALHSLPSQRN